MKGLSDTYVESVIRAFAKGRTNARQGTLAARGQRRISGVPENAKVNHSPLKIGNKSPYFQEIKNIKPFFAPFLLRLKRGLCRKQKKGT